MISTQFKSFGLLCLLFVSAVHSWGTNCPNCQQNSDFLKVASWNANLIPGISTNTQERLNGAIAYLTGADVTALGLDVICLQEVYGSAQRSLIDGLRNSLPYSYAGDQGQQQGQCLKVCNAQSITALTNCSLSCTDNNGANCFLTNCNQQFLALDVNCQACVGNGQGSAADILNACAMDANAEANTQTQCNLFGGSTGNVILSNQPLSATQMLTFKAQGSSGKSGALWAKLNWRGNNVNFVCTNLYPDNMMASQDNSADLNGQQTQELVQWLNNVPANEPLIVAGDFNFGPAVGQNAGMYAQSYDQMINAGFQSALIANVPADQVPCTSCSNGNFVTTHIFIKTNTNPPACVNDVNLIGLNQTVATSNGQVPLSSSYGVYATICYAGTAVPTIAPPPAAQEQPVIVLPIQHINDDQTRFGEVSSGSAALPVIMFSAAAALSFFF